MANIYILLNICPNFDISILIYFFVHQWHRFKFGIWVYVDTIQNFCSSCYLKIFIVWKTYAKTYFGDHLGFIPEVPTTPRMESFFFGDMSGTAENIFQKTFSSRRCLSGY